MSRLTGKTLPEKILWLGDKVVANQVEKDRGGEAERVHAVEDAAVAFDHHAKILDADIALDGAHYEATAKTENTNGKRQAGGFERREWSGPPQCGAKRSGAQNPAEKAFPGFVGAHA